MNKSSAILTILTLTIMLLMLPTAYAADVQLSDTCFLADAITAANTDAATGACPAGDGVDTISISEDITLNAALPHITTEITIEGGGFTISGNERFRIFAVNGGSLTVSDLTMTKGFGDWGGSIANLRGRLTIKNSRINSSSASEGGAIGNDGTLSIENSDVSHNSADIGGAIYSVSGRITITGSTLNGNTSEGNGGTIAIESGLTTIESSIVSLSIAKGRGGGIWVNEEGRLEVTGDSIISENSSRKEGGGIYIGGSLDGAGSLEITKSTISHNSSGFNGGGGIYVDWDTVTIIDESTISYNSSRNDGGGIYGYWAKITIMDSTVRNNSAEGDNAYSMGGGGIRIDGIYASTTIINSTVIGNSAELGGGMSIYNNQRAEMKITNSAFIDNVAFKDGGGIYVEIGESTLTHVTLANNSANRGGGLYRDADAEVNMQNSIIAGSSGADCFGRLNENVGNLIADGSCFATLSGDPMLGELVEPKDGSPPYFPLLVGSPAIDSAHRGSCEKSDQVGTKRPQGAGCDIGAYELPQE